MPGQPSAPSTPGTPSTSCCETGRPVATDPVTGQAICSCQYEAGGAAGRSGYSRLAAGSSSLPYSAAYSAGEQAPYPSIGVDSSYFAAFVSSQQSASCKMMLLIFLVTNGVTVIKPTNSKRHPNTAQTIFHNRLVINLESYITN